MNYQGSEVFFSSSWGEGELKIPLPGSFNIENAAIVLAYLLANGINLNKACDALNSVKAPSGRMQKLQTNERAIYVDYAHTPNALESALKALRPDCLGKLWCVFGCGGDRDTGKRPLMAKIAEQYADHIVITSDNPREENPISIIKDILNGIKNKNTVKVIEDRALAINWVISNSNKNDLILIAGKGHENYQEINGERQPFSDTFQANFAVKSLRKIK